MTCQACERAQQRPRSGIFMAGCMQCDARALAASPEARDALISHQITPAYRAALERLAPGNAAEMHQAVKNWHTRMHS